MSKDNRSMEKKTYHITTFGCQMNEHDSETIAGMLSELGYEPALSREDSDVAIINTCSVRENADKRFFGTLGQLKKRKEQNPEFTVCVCGCMMQQQHIIDSIKTKYPWVDIIFGTHNIHEFPQLLQRVMTEKEKIVNVWEDGGEIVEGLPAKRLYQHKAFVNIMYGCNNFCTYCIVPYTRGRERSRKPEDIVAEVKRLVADGVREVTLLGQNVNSYRGISGSVPAGPVSDFGREESDVLRSSAGMNREDSADATSLAVNEAPAVTDFTDLIYLLHEIDGLERIRFMTSHPKDLSDRLIEAYGRCEKLCNYIHLPVQSGSNRVLKRMNRKYTREDYLALIRKLKQTVPEITISTDIIVGFPGETEEDFEDTLDLVRQVEFDSAFTFLYSIRKGTPAEQYGDQIPEEVKHRRFNRLVDLINEGSAKKNAAYVDRVEQVLVEGTSKNDPNTYCGRTEGFKLVNFPASQDHVGRIVPVKITRGKTFSLEGILTDSAQR